MEMEFKKLIKAKADYSGNRSVQTGFPSPATHYREPRIDLNKELSSCNDATFFVRVKGDNWATFNILNEDVLIIDRAATSSDTKLALIVREGSFEVIHLGAASKTPFELWGVITYIIHRAV